MKRTKGHFIVLEGLDGTGKSTQVRLLNEYYSSAGLPFHFIHFPRTDNESAVFGSMIASFLRGDYGPLEQVHPELVALIYAGDRYNAASELKSLIESGVNILCDRYVFSNIAFQCAKLHDQNQREQLMQRIFHMEFSYFQIPEPDISVFLHVPIDFVQQQLNNQRTGSDRTYLHGKDDIHEQSMDFQKAVEQVYLETTRMMPDKLEYLNCIDASGNMMSPEQIHRMLKKLLQNKRLI